MKTLEEQRKSFLQEKVTCDARIAAIKLELDNAAARFHRTGVRMQNARYYLLKSEQAGLKTKSQKLQLLLSHVGQQLKNRNIQSSGEYRMAFGEHFIAAAKLVLTGKQFEEVVIQARILAEQQRERNGATNEDQETGEKAEG